MPGYIDPAEVGLLARCIASIDRDILYILLAFHPQFHMSDLPVTSRRLVERSLDAARKAGCAECAWEMSTFFDDIIDLEIIGLWTTIYGYISRVCVGIFLTRK